MADSRRKQPITRHPLFPATVALWFGAIFGLASLAIRTSLIEQAVLATKIHAIIPAAAPPLGATAQLFLALAAAAAGGILGAFLARRLGRPRSKTRERRRDAANMSGATSRAIGMDGAPAAQYAEHSDDASPRRRQLALKEEPATQALHENAPLPGQSQQILDVTEFDLEGFEADPKEAGDGMEDTGLAPDAAEEAPYDSADGARQPAPVQDFEQEETEVEGGSQLFHAPEEEPGFGESRQEEDVQTFGEPPEQVFNVPSQGQSGPETLDDKREDMELEDLEAPQEDESVQHPFFVKPGSKGEPAAGTASNDESETVAGPVHEADPQAFGQTFADGTGSDSVSEIDEEPADVPDAAPFASPDQGAGATDSVCDEPRTAMPSEPVAKGLGQQAAAPANAAAARLLAAELTDLSHAELLERLALSLERKRNPDADTNAPAVFEATRRTAEPEAAAPEHPAECVSEDAPDFSNIAVANDEGILSEDDGSEVEPEAAELDDAVTAELVPVAEPPRVPSIPAALRPIDLEDESDTDSLPDFVPPRHISMTESGSEPPKEAPPAWSESAEPSGDAEDVQEFHAEADADKTAPDHEGSLSGDEQELEEGYSSLLSLSRPGHQQFVRIEEPEADDAEIKPFVVFPNDGGGASGPFSKPKEDAAPQVADPKSDDLTPAPTSDSEERRFDQPQEARSGDRPDPQLDAEETERSLRAALATLQRMSGAA